MQQANISQTYRKNKYWKCQQNSQNPNDEYNLPGPAWGTDILSPHWVTHNEVPKQRKDIIISHPQMISCAHKI